MFENEHKWNNNPSCHYMGCFCPLLYDQYWQTSKVFDTLQSADGMAVSTFKPVGEVDIDFRANTQFPDQPRPTVINVAWKSKRQKKQKRQKIINFSFGASLIGNRSTRKQLINLRQKFDLENH